MAEPTGFSKAVADRYRIERELGRGGMATVYLAEDLRHGRKVAIKVFRDELSVSLGAERFEREIRVTATLQHPNILPLHDSGSAEGALYYVMPYVEGESLRHRLQSVRQMPLGEAVTLAREVADALQYAHQLGVIHRDLKPENILLSRGHAVLADFGIAHTEQPAAERLTATGLALGTPYYMSPEQVMGEAELDGRSDQYALACVLFELLAGAPPFAGANSSAIAVRHLTEAPSPLRDLRPGIPEDVARVVERGLAKDKVERFPDMSAFSAALEAAVAAAMPTEAGPLPAPESTPPTRHARAWIIGAVAIAMAALVGGRLWYRVPAGPSGSLAIVVLPFENTTGEPGLAYLASGIGDELVSRLRAMPGFSVTSALSGDWLLRPGQQPIARARGLGGDLALSAQLGRSGDSLWVLARLIDARTSMQTWTVTIPVVPARLSDAESRLAAGVAAAVLGRVAPAPKPGVAVNPESHRLTLEGWHYMMGSGATPKARAAFLEAIKLDPLNARAWSGLSSVWSSLANIGGNQAEEAWSRAEAAASRALAIDSTQGSALANLGFMRAVRDGDMAGGEAMIRHAISLEPANPELHSLILATILRYDGQLARAVSELQIGQQLDVVSPRLIERLGFGQLCAGQPMEALATYRRGLTLDPTYRPLQRSVVRALSRLGRWDEALAAWRSLASEQGDTLMLSALSGARGEPGFWTARHVEGRRALQGMLKRARDGSMSPGQLAMAHLHAGDLDRGVQLMQEDIRTGNSQVYRLPCHDSSDEFRDTPALQSLRLRYGRLGTVGKPPAGAAIRNDSAR